jgi:hypothetical protein
LPPSRSVSPYTKPPQASSFSLKDGVLIALGSLVSAIICYKAIQWCYKLYYDREARLHQQELRSYATNSSEDSLEMQHKPSEQEFAYIRPLHTRPDGGFLTNTISSDTSPWFYIRLGARRGRGIQVRAPKDSGADKSIISMAMLNFIPQSENLRHYECVTKTIVTACGQVTPVRFSVLLWYTFIDTDMINSHSMEFMTLVVDNLESDILVGQDILCSPNKVYEDRFHMHISKDTNIKRTVTVNPGHNMICVPLRTNQRYQDGRRTITVNYIDTEPMNPELPPPGYPGQSPFDDTASGHTDDGVSHNGEQIESSCDPQLQQQHPLQQQQQPISPIPPPRYSMETKSHGEQQLPWQLDSFN